jgi:DNA ligase-1
VTGLADLVRASEDVAALRGRNAKIDRLAASLRGLHATERGVGAALLAGEIPGGRNGIGPAQLAAAAVVAPAATPLLSLGELDRGLTEIRQTTGAGSQSRRAATLVDLFARASIAEQSFLSRLLLGELRQGATEGLVLEAIARAAEVPAALLRRAVMLCGDLAQVAEVALESGAPGLSAIRLRLFRPIQPMLARPAGDLAAALSGLHSPILEHKLDGARIQVHKSGTHVQVFSRQGNRVTDAVPEIVEQIAPLPESDLVLDGEVLALRPDGRPRPFQVTMRRFARGSTLEDLRSRLPLTPVFFDCLHRAGTSLIDQPARARFAALADCLPGGSLVPRLEPKTARDAEAFLAAALSAGHEGLMAKSADSPYEAGGRGGSWLKVKPAHTLDLVVLAAEWGSGRRRAWLSNLHLGAREGSGFVMLGKTFKGLSDAMLAWQTQRLLGLELARGPGVVEVRPELVVEIAFNEIQESPRYPGGLALRFARVKRHRHDKCAAEASDMGEVRALFDRQVAYREEPA